MSIHEATVNARGVDDGDSDAADEHPCWQSARLTTREQQIAELVGRGLTTNRQIVGKLVISERTVETHVSNMLRKIGLTSRAQLAA